MHNLPAAVGRAAIESCWRRYFEAQEAGRRLNLEVNHQILLGLPLAGSMGGRAPPDAAGPASSESESSAAGAASESDAVSRALLSP